MKRRVLVTGGAGFVGSHLTRRLHEDGFSVRVLDREVTVDQGLEQVEFVRGDIRDIDLLHSLSRDCEAVYHCAAVLPISRAGREFTEINVQGTRNVLDAALAAEVAQVVHVSSSSVYGIPEELPITESSPTPTLGPYAASKLAAEDICHEYRQRGLPVSLVRPRTTLGPGRLGIFSMLFEWIRLGRSVFLIGDGSNLFQFVSVRDLVDAIVRIPPADTAGEDFNVGAAEFGTVRDDLEALCVYAGSGARTRPLPAAPARMSLHCLSLLKLLPLVEWHYRTADQPYYFDITKARELLDWTPQDSNLQLLQHSYDWYLRWRQQGFASGTTHRKAARPGILSLLRHVARF